MHERMGTVSAKVVYLIKDALVDTDIFLDSSQFPRVVSLEHRKKIVLCSNERWYRVVLLRRKNNTTMQMPGCYNDTAQDSLLSTR